MLDVRLLHHLQELARVGATATLDVAPLPLGIDGVEGEARLARSRQAGDDRQALARDVDVDPLEVVLARAADGNMGQHKVNSFQLCSDLREARRSVNAGSRDGCREGASSQVRGLRAKGANGRSCRAGHRNLLDCLRGPTQPLRRPRLRAAANRPWPGQTAASGSLAWSASMPSTALEARCRLPVAEAGAAARPAAASEDSERDI